MQRRRLFTKAQTVGATVEERYAILAAVPLARINHDCRLAVFDEMIEYGSRLPGWFFIDIARDYGPDWIEALENPTVENPYHGLLWGFGRIRRGAMANGSTSEQHNPDNIRSCDPHSTSEIVSRRFRGDSRTEAPPNNH